MSENGELGYNVKKLWIALLVLTLIEVLIGIPREPRWLIWSGLLLCATWKGALIFMYFMHMKYERFIVWSLIAPTPILVAVVVFAIMPDVSFNDGIRDHPVGDQLNREGQVVSMEESRSGGHGEPAAEH